MMKKKLGNVIVIIFLGTQSVSSQRIQGVFNTDPSITLLKNNKKIDQSECSIIMQYKEDGFVENYQIDSNWQELCFPDKLVDLLIYCPDYSILINSNSASFLNNQVAFNVLTNPFNVHRFKYIPNLKYLFWGKIYVCRYGDVTHRIHNINLIYERKRIAELKLLVEPYASPR